MSPGQPRRLTEDQLIELVIGRKLEMVEHHTKAAERKAVVLRARPVRWSARWPG